jgi:nucleoid-associated protein YgaU
MLTGLLVIVLVGVLLSEYLGDGANKTPAKMAAIDAGEKERTKLQNPPSAPDTVPNSFKDAPVTPMLAQGQSEIPPATPKAGDGVVIQSPVVPVNVDMKTQMIAQGPTGPGSDAVELGGPTPGAKQALYVTPAEKAIENKAVEGKMIAKEPMIAPPVTEPAVTSYTIAKGDNLTIISKKFYKSATSADLARIVAANKSTLKDEKSILVVGKKLNIPDIAPKSATPVITTVPPTVPSTPGVAVEGPSNLPPGMMPGSGAMTPPITMGPTTPVGVTTPKVPGADKVYVVVAGDNLTKISKKLSATNPAATLPAILSLNKLTMDSVIKVGQKIKIPEAPATIVSSGPSRARI